MASPGLPDLTGRWRIDRRIIGLNGRFRGVAEISSQHYAEHGLLRLPHYTGDAHQAYLFTQSENHIALHFADGRPFIRLAFSDGRASAQHVCGDDVYEAQARLRQDGWTLAYRVRGPRKNYALVSRLTRQA